MFTGLCLPKAHMYIYVCICVSISIWIIPKPLLIHDTSNNFRWIIHIWHWKRHMYTYIQRLHIHKRTHNLNYTKFTFILLQFSIYFFITPTFFRVCVFFCSSHVIWKIAYFTCPCIFVCLEIYKNIIKIRHLSKSLQLFVRRRAESISFHMIFFLFFFYFREIIFNFFSCQKIYS